MFQADPRHRRKDEQAIPQVRVWRPAPLPLAMTWELLPWGVGCWSSRCRPAPVMPWGSATRPPIISKLATGEDVPGGSTAPLKSEQVAQEVMPWEDRHRCRTWTDQLRIKTPAYGDCHGFYGRCGISGIRWVSIGRCVLFPEAGGVIHHGRKRVMYGRDKDVRLYAFRNA
jgi:hypothetical protein